MRLVQALLLLILAASHAEASSEFPTGTVVESVAIRAEPSQTYALYLPRDYTPDKQWPILYCLDASGRGLIPIKLFRDTAETLGYILVSTNFVRNERTGEQNTMAMRKWWDDTHSRLSIDSRRTYAAGFSGGARRAVMLDRIFPGSLAGVILCGAGFPFDIMPDTSTKLDVFMTAGDRDFNYYEMKDLARSLARFPVSSRLEIFDGAHRWPPDHLSARALGWLHVASMRRGTTPRKNEWIASLFASQLAEAKSLAGKGLVLEAWRLHRDLATNFKGLVNTDEAQELLTRLEESEAFRSALQQDEARDERDTDLLKELERKVVQALRNPSRSIRDLTRELGLAPLQKRSLSPDRQEALSATRILETLFVQASFYLPEDLFRRKAYAGAAFVLDLAAAIRPDDPHVLYERAAAHAAAGHLRDAVKALESAIKAGMKDRKRVAEDSRFDTIRNQRKFRALVESLHD